MSAKKRLTRRYAVCIRNEGNEASLERNKLYVVLPDRKAPFGQSVVWSWTVANTSSVGVAWDTQRWMKALGAGAGGLLGLAAWSTGQSSQIQRTGAQATEARR